MELYIACRSALRLLSSSDKWNKVMTIDRVYCGAFMTALEMQGISISILLTEDEKVIKLLDHPVGVNAGGWRNHEAAPPPMIGASKLKCETPSSSSQSRGKEGDATSSASQPSPACEAVARLLNEVIKVLIDNEQLLTKLDQVAGNIKMIIFYTVVHNPSSQVVIVTRGR